MGNMRSQILSTQCDQVDYEKVSTKVRECRDRMGILFIKKVAVRNASTK